MTPTIVNARPDADVGYFARETFNGPNNSYEFVREMHTGQYDATVRLSDGRVGNARTTKGSNETAEDAVRLATVIANKMPPASKAA